MKKNKQLQLDIISIIVSLIVLAGRYLGPIILIFALQRFGADIQYTITNLAVMYALLIGYSVAKGALKAVEVVREEM